MAAASTYVIVSHLTCYITYSHDHTGTTLQYAFESYLHNDNDNRKLHERLRKQWDMWMVQYRRIPLSRFKRKDTPILFVEKDCTGGHKSKRFCILGEESSGFGAKYDKVRVVRPWGPHGGACHPKGGHWYESRQPKQRKSELCIPPEETRVTPSSETSSHGSVSTSSSPSSSSSSLSSSSASSLPLETSTPSVSSSSSSPSSSSSSSLSPVLIAQRARLGNTKPYPSSTRTNVYVQGFSTVGKPDKIAVMSTLAYASIKILRAQRIGIRAVRKICNHVVGIHRDSVVRERFPLTSKTTMPSFLSSYLHMINDRTWKICLICKLCFSRKTPSDVLRRIAKECGVESSKNAIPREAIMSYMMKLLNIKVIEDVETLMKDVKNKADKKLGRIWCLFLRNMKRRRKRHKMCTREASIEKHCTR